MNDRGRKEELGGVDVLGTIPYTMTGYHRWLDTNGYPAIKPPWGTLNAIDLNTGEYRWRVTLGEWPELTAKGIPPTGTENYGGPVVTAGGLSSSPRAATNICAPSTARRGRNSGKQSYLPPVTPRPRPTR